MLEAEGVRCWRGEPGPEGKIEPEHPIKTNPEFFDNWDEVLQEIEETMRRECREWMAGLTDLKGESN